MLLAIDTSTQTSGIALYDEFVLIGEMIWRTASHHTVELAPAVQDLMNRCMVSPEIGRASCRERVFSSV